MFLTPVTEEEILSLIKDKFVKHSEGDDDVPCFPLLKVADLNKS